MKETMPMLTISVPTFNRGELLRAWLEHHFEFLDRYPVRVLVVDNASTDDTRDVVNEYQAANRQLDYVINDENIGPIENLRKAYNYPDSHYVWIIGDSYVFDEEDLLNVLEALSSERSLVLINLNQSKIERPRFLKVEELVAEYSGVLSCVCTAIYNKSKLGFFPQAEFLTYYPHVVFSVRSLEMSQGFCLYVPAAKIKVADFASNRRNWANTNAVFDIGLVNWSNTIDFLPDVSSAARKKAKIQFGQTSQLFSMKGILWLRAQGFLTNRQLLKYFNYFSELKFRSFVALFIISMVPKSPLRKLAQLLGKAV